MIVRKTRMVTRVATTALTLGFGIWSSATFSSAQGPVTLLPAVPANQAPAQNQVEPLPAPRPLNPGPRPAEIAPVVPPNTRQIPTALPLEEVLASVERHYPLLAAVEQVRTIASGGLLSAVGEFDLTMRYDERVINGSFDSHLLNLGFEQPTPFLGIGLSAGYRLGAGEFPTAGYRDNLRTGQGGEFRAGMTLPLLRDRAIDKRRANLQQANLTRQIAEPVIQTQRILFIRAASRFYWDWLGAARRRDIARELLRVAQNRNTLLRRLVEEQRLAGVEVTDNLRVVADRQANLVRFQRLYEKASIDLSLFFRDEQGAILRPDLARIAPSFPEPIQPRADGLQDDVALALRLRPEIQRFQLERDRLNVDLRQAENQLLPGVNVALVGAQDVGVEKKSLDREFYEAALIVDVPLQRRMARGKVQESQGKIAQISAQEMFQRDTVTAEVQDTVSALVRAYDVLIQARRNVELAQEVLRVENRRLQEGRSTVLVVNLRELALFDAQIQEINTLNEFYRSYADYRAALGFGAPQEVLEAVYGSPEPNRPVIPAPGIPRLIHHKK